MVENNTIKLMNKPNTVNLMNKSGFYSNPNPHIFSNVYLIVFILSISLIAIGYAIYYYTNLKSNLVILTNSSYYGTDIALYEPIFQDTSKNVNDCITICEKDVNCDGITYNSDTKACLGTKVGQVRNENSNYSAWVKPVSSSINQNTNKDFKKSVLVGYTKTMMVIDATKLQNPYMIGNFAYSFNLTIYDFNKNYGSWRHIFHRGTPIKNGATINYQSWENLIIDYPVQSIGVWLAPFTNNLRIAVTTTSSSNSSYGSYSDAFIEKCNSITGDCYITDMPSGKWVDKSRASDGSKPKVTIDTYIEYIDHDIQNIPLNTEVNITVNFIGKDVEIYFNGKIVKIYSLDGIPTVSKTNLYIMNENSIGGEISNLLYYPDTLKLVDIKSIILIK